MTVLFIGDFPNRHITALKDFLNPFFAAQKPFGIPFDSFVYATNPKRPRMVWCKGAINQNFTAICEDTSAAVQSFCEKNNIDFHPEKHPEIIPHVTLSRFKPTFHMPSLRILDVNAFPLPLTINETHLFKSDLTPEGAVYSLLHSFRFSK